MSNESNTIIDDLGDYELITASYEPREPDSVEVIALCVPALHANNLAKFLAVNLPAPDLMHLKRVAKIEVNSKASAVRTLAEQCEFNDGPVTLAVLLCTRSQYGNNSAATLSDQPSSAGLPSVCVDFINAEPYASCLRKSVFVPLEVPRCGVEYQRWNLKWPLSSAPPRPVRKFEFDSSEKPLIAQAMQCAVQVALDGFQHGCVARGAAVIDWKTKSIVAVAHDRRRTAPASHRHCFSCTGSLSESDATPAFLPIWHAVPTVCDLVAKRQLLQYYQHMHDARDLHSLGVKRASEGCPSEPNTEIPYLLTDCDVVLTHEPCIMCAMALTHARARRVLFALPSSVQDGGCGGRPIKLQLIKSLNHHFEAVEGVATKQVQAALHRVCGGPEDATAARLCHGGGC